MWVDIDFGNNSIRVLRTHHYAHGFSEPKTASSRRTVPMIPTLSDKLLELHKTRGSAGPRDLVFPNRKGNPLDRRNLVKRKFEKALHAAGLDAMRFHDLRHTFAALCIEAGTDPKTLQSMMGHSSIRVTLDTYGHLYQTAYDRAARGLEAVVSRYPKVVEFPKDRAN